MSVENKMRNQKVNAEVIRFANNQLKMWKKKVASLQNSLPHASGHEKEWQHYELRMANAMTRKWASEVAYQLAR